MRNVQLLIEYDGTHYAGWQWQKNEKTIQETLTGAIEQAIQEKIKLYGASRTDAGVHAFGQVANFKTISDIPPERLLLAINFYFTLRYYGKKSDRCIRIISCPIRR
ncbi:MAG: hypothetical protein L3J17_03880 [Candidatus Jettenia sp.]|nr:MAG: hypothetical protein L3J17_03880 [Candidatus Jettenia sp.]